MNKIWDNVVVCSANKQKSSTSYRSDGYRGIFTVTLSVGRS